MGDQLHHRAVSCKIMAACELMVRQVCTFTGLMMSSGRFPSDGSYGKLVDQPFSQSLVVHSSVD